MIREADLEEMEKKWREENELIMREYPAIDADPSVEARTYIESPPSKPEAQEELPLAAPAAPDDDPTPPAQRELP